MSDQERAVREFLRKEGQRQEKRDAQKRRDQREILDGLRRQNERRRQPEAGVECIEMPLIEVGKGRLICATTDEAPS